MWDVLFASWEEPNAIEDRLFIEWPFLGYLRGNIVWIDNLRSRKMRDEVG